ncbi:MAG: lysophospholipid acyltransferase family protein [Bauldia sp.]
MKGVAGKKMSPAGSPERIAEKARRLAAKRAFRHAPRQLPKPSLLGGLYSNLAATYLRIVNATSSFTFAPARLDVVATGQTPFILVGWHGQGFMVPFIRPSDMPIDLLVSRTQDGEHIARAFRQFGLGMVRGSGAGKAHKSVRSGGAAAFIAMRRRLDEGVSICLSADFDRNAPRHASLGIALLAKVSGRPILPAAIATSRRITLNNWDRATINLPFSRAACVFSDPIVVPSSADDALLEEKRRQVEDALNAATKRAYEIAERRHG